MGSTLKKNVGKTSGYNTNGCNRCLHIFGAWPLNILHIIFFISDISCITTFKNVYSRQSHREMLVKEMYRDIHYHLAFQSNSDCNGFARHYSLQRETSNTRADTL